MVICGGKGDQDDIEGDDIEDDQEDDDDIEDDNVNKDDDDIEDDNPEDDEEVDEISEVGTECNINERKKEGVVYPLKVAKDIIKKRHVNLLLIEKNGQHYCKTIKHFSRLVSSQISRRNRQHLFFLHA